MRVIAVFFPPGPTLHSTHSTQTNYVCPYSTRFNDAYKTCTFFIYAEKTEQINPFELLRYTLQAGSSIKSQIPSESHIHAVLRNRPCNFAHVFKVPLPSLSRIGSYFFIYFRQLFVFFYHFFGYLSLQGSRISSEKNQKRKKKHS